MRIDVETNEEQDSQLSGLTEIPSGPSGAPERYGPPLGEWLNQERLKELRSKLLAEDGKVRIPVHLGAQVVGYVQLGVDGRLRWEPGPPELLAPASNVMREALGQLVRHEWMTWAREQHPELQKRSWLIPWEELSEPEREVDRRIGERLFNAGRAYERACADA